MARGLVVPGNNNVAVRLANFGDKPVTIGKGQPIGKFLHRDEGSVNLFEVNAVENDSRDKQLHASQFGDVMAAGTVPDNWIEEIAVDFSRLSETQEKSFKEFLGRNADVFALKGGTLGRTHLMEHTIDTRSATPIKQAPRRLPPFKRDEVDKQVDDLLTQGRIEPSNSPWSSPVVLAKKRDGPYRLCIDRLQKAQRRHCQGRPTPTAY